MEISRENLELLKKFSDSLKETLSLYGKVKALNLRAVIERERLESELNLEYEEVCAELITKKLPKLKNSEDLIFKKFKNLGVTINFAASHNKLSYKLDDLAKYLIDNIKILEGLREDIKNALNKKTNQVHIDLPKKSSAKLIVIHFIEMMYEIGMIENVDISDKVIGYRIEMNNTPVVRIFFEGAYYERYIRIVLNEILKEKGFSCISLYNLEITLSDGRKQELDIVFLLDDKELLWFEVKSHSKLSKQDIQKYVFIGHLLNLDENNSFVVLRNSSKENNSRLSSVLPMGVIDGALLKKRLSPILDKMKKNISKSSRDQHSVTNRKPIRRRMVSNGK